MTAAQRIEDTFNVGGSYRFERLALPTVLRDMCFNGDDLGPVARVSDFDRSALAPASGVQRGGYILWEATEKPDVILIGTGSEVHIAMEAGKLLSDQGVAARVVSLPSWELFDALPAEYRDW